MNNLVYAYNECERCFSVDKNKMILELLDLRLTQNLYHYNDILEKAAKKVLFEIESSDNFKNIIQYEKTFIKLEEKSTDRRKHYD